MSPSSLAIFKLLLALAAGAILAFPLVTGRAIRQARWVLAAIAAFAIIAFVPMGSGGRGLVHRWEMFHYYLGAKYHAELGYKGLYACVAVADAQASIRGTAERRIRDLETDGVMTGAVALAHAERCTIRFSPERWSAFSRDVAAFRKLTPTRKQWEQMQQDHGYNPPPLWTVGGRALASLTSPTLSGLTALASVDLALMALSLALLGWAFGAEVGLLACIFWGTQAAADFGWTGGSLLRHDWLFLCVLGLACLRRGKPFWAGAALATAALLRVFPVLLLAGLFALIAASWLRRRALDRSHARVLLGVASATILLGLASSLLVGPNSYARFWEHIQLRNTAAVSNHMGLRTLFAYSSETPLSDFISRRLLDPAQPWVDLRLARAQALRPVYLCVASGITLAVLLICSRLRTTWMAVALSLPLVPALTDPSCYYYCLWVLLCVLAKARRSVAVCLLGVAAGGQLLVLRMPAYDTRYAALALLYMASAIGVLAIFADGPIARIRRALSKSKLSVVGRLEHE